MSKENAGEPKLDNYLPRTFEKYFLNIDDPQVLNSIRCLVP